jgi:phosphoenolpyruvate synthase/pyruvate phosphate dikinase
MVTRKGGGAPPSGVHGFVLPAIANVRIAVRTSETMAGARESTVSKGLRDATRQGAERPHTEQRIAWLGHGACHDCALLGGKASNLCHLAAEFRVPPGFCLTAAAFDDTAHAERSGGDPATSAALPPQLRDQLAEAYRSLGERCGVEAPSVAVRSSGLDEDGAAASFAGQHETYLNVVGAEAVAEAVARCWSSVQAPRALEYRRRQGLSLAGARIAVLVQQLVPADVSAVLFTANPMTGNRDEMVVTANWGLGESLVGGTVTPDTYVVRKGDLTMASRQIAEKRRMTVMVSGGTRELDVPRFLRTQPTLTHEQVTEMGHLGRALEAKMGHPVDLECAYHAGRLSVLQCRPITTLEGMR